MAVPSLTRLELSRFLHELAQLCSPPLLAPQLNLCRHQLFLCASSSSSIAGRDSKFVAHLGEVASRVCGVGSSPRCPSIDAMVTLTSLNWSLIALSIVRTSFRFSASYLFCCFHGWFCFFRFFRFPLSTRFSAGSSGVCLHGVCPTATRFTLWGLPPFAPSNSSRLLNLALHHQAVAVFIF